MGRGFFICEGGFRKETACFFALFTKKGDIHCKKDTKGGADSVLLGNIFGQKVKKRNAYV